MEEFLRGRVSSSIFRGPKKEYKSLKELEDRVIGMGWKRLSNLPLFGIYWKPTGLNNNIEYCKINTFNKPVTADKLTPNGLVPIFETNKGREEWCPDLKGKLKADVWKVIGDTKYFIRHAEDLQSKSQTNVKVADNPTEMLKQLGELRDSNVITEEEFQKKKKEILERNLKSSNTYEWTYD